MTKERMEEIKKRIKDTFDNPFEGAEENVDISQLKLELLQRGFEFGNFYDYKSRYMVKDIGNIRLQAVPESGIFMIGKKNLAADVIIYNTIYHLWQIKNVLVIYGLTEEAKSY